MVASHSCFLHWKPGGPASLLLLMTVALAACSSNGANSRTASAAGNAAPARSGTSADSAPLGAAADADLPPASEPTGPEIRVTWEALAVERDQIENPRFRSRQRAGILQNHKIVLVSESHPDAKKNMMGRSAVENKGVAVAAVPDAEMVAFMRALGQRGFFKVAQPSVAVGSLFDDPNARGRITVERGDDSMTLVSLRGQGLSDATKSVPALYSEVKQSILLMRNEIPTMSVVTSGRTPMAR